MPELDRVIDFPTVLASSAHDMKNSLCLLIQSIETLAVKLEDTEHAQELSHLHYEAQRINMGLIQMLALYRQEQQGLPVNIDLHYVAELVDELIVGHELYAHQRHVKIEVDIDPDLTLYADRDLLSALLNDIIVNALRYTADTIIISAESTTAGVDILIEDDGPGYPQKMLDAADMPLAQLDLLAARTGLGLYFAHLIAAQHVRNGHQGKIKLSNGGSLGGSIFKLTLP